MIRREIFSSLQFKFGVLIIFIEVVALSITGIIYVSQFSEQVDDRLISRAQIPGNLITSGKLDYDVVRDREQLIEIIGDDPLEAMFISITQNVLYSLNTQHEGKEVSEIPNLQLNWFTTNTTTILILRETRSVNYFITIITPVLALEDSKPYYFVYIKISANHAAVEKQNIILLFLLGSAVCIVSTTVVIIVSFKKMLLNRINNVVQVLKCIQDGDLTARVEGRVVNDEIGILQNGVNSMATYRMNTEEKLKYIIEDLRRSNAELEQFAYIASHDLQEPLRSIASFAQLLLKRYKNKLDSDADEYIDFIVGGALRLKKLIIDLLEYSRIGTRGKPFKEIDTNLTLTNALNDLNHLIERENAKITHDPLPVIVADETQIKQLFQNLISNGIKFRSKESPKIHITGKLENDHWLFSVCDNGIGIDSQYFERIFVIFQCLHKVDEYEGTGIGLAICKKIVERHRGKIMVESELEKGSTFSFLIPRLSVTENEILKTV